MKPGDIIKIIDQLAKEIAQAQPIIIQPKSKYKFSRSNWYVAEFNERYYWEVEEWCSQQFGPHPRHPDAWSRWFHKYENKIHFRDEQDYIWFILKWGK